MAYNAMANRRPSDHRLSSDNDDSYSTYSEDFENDSRTPSPSSKKRHHHGNRRNTGMLQSEHSASTFASTHRTEKKSAQSERRKKLYKTPMTAFKSGWKSTSFAKSSKKKAFVKPDTVQARMLSAQRNRINVVNNELGEAQLKLEEISKENKLLKTLQHRQDKALRKFEDKEGDLPRLISQHMEDQRVLKARLRKSQESERVLETRLRESNEEIQKMENTLRRLKRIVDDKNLGERSELAKELNTAEDKLYDSERKNKELEKKLELTTQSFSRQLNHERAKHRETKERLDNLEDKCNAIQNKLKEKERALEVSNIYALRNKHTPEKSFHGKVAIPSPRQITDKPPEVKTDSTRLALVSTSKTAVNSEPQKPPRPLEQPSANVIEATSGVKDFRQTIKSPSKNFSANKEDSVLLDLSKSDKGEPFSNGVNGLRLDKTHKEAADSPDKDVKRNKSVFLTANFDSPNSTFVSDQEPSPNRQSPPSGASSPEPIKEEFSVNLEAKKKFQIEDDIEAKMKQEEERRRKAALLAKMKNVEEDEATSFFGGKKSDGGDILNLLKKDSTTSTSKQDKDHATEEDEDDGESTISVISKKSNGEESLATVSLREFNAGRKRPSRQSLTQSLEDHEDLYSLLTPLETSFEEDDLPLLSDDNAAREKLMEYLRRDIETSQISQIKEDAKNSRREFEKQLLKKFRGDVSRDVTTDELVAFNRGFTKRKSSLKTYKFPTTVENLHLGLPTRESSKSSLDKDDEPEISFGGYAPTVAAQPKRKPRAQASRRTSTPPGSESDEPLLDVTSGKSKKNDLLEQLFGEQAANPTASNGVVKKQNSFHSPRGTKSSMLKTTPRNQPVHSGYPWERNVVAAPQQGNGDARTREKKKDEILSSTPLIKAVPSFSEDDIEEVTL